MERDIIIKKANAIMEETKNNQKKYHEERMIIFSLLEDCNEEKNIKLLENVIKLFDKNKRMETKNEKCYKLEKLANSIKNQKVRQEDSVSDRMILFLIEDIENCRYTFFTRENAKIFIKENKDIFKENTEIKVIENDNMDIESLIF